MEGLGKEEKGVLGFIEARRPAIIKEENIL
jgi:hypothetical protein